MKSVGLVCFLFFGLIVEGGSIRITRFVVPSVAVLGAVLELDCAYDMETDQLYAVKWYKDSEEFFRCRSDGEVQSFDADGVQLYHAGRSSLGSCPVSITVLGFNSGGQYRCEISTEGPEFKTTAKSVTLKISKNIKSPSKRIQTNFTEPNAEHNKTAVNCTFKIVLNHMLLVIVICFNLKLNFCLQY